ncbi:MAG TPA: SRPBCC domain-containing protein, partial [Acidimicrobiales bacterium]|nr:SRPBCC domain-containing protein [Acidimicrobiales bacterium]
AQVRAWFGAEVEWELRPGGAARFAPTDGGLGRTGVIEAVTAAEILRFRWWPVERERVEGDDEPASEVTYTLEDVPDGTRLTVTEQPLGASASASMGAIEVSPWDFRMLGLLLHAGARLPICV